MIMKPLSIITYYLNNKRKVIPVIAIIALSVLGITSAVVFTGSINKETVQRMKEFEHAYSVDAVNPITQQDEMELIRVELLQKNDVANVLRGSTQGTKTPSILGASYAGIYLFTQSDSVTFMRLMNWKLAAGQMPANSHEVILTQALATMKKLHIGDYMGSEVDENDYYPGKIQIVGIADTQNKLISGIGILSDIHESSSLYVFPKAGHENEIDEYVQTIPNTYKHFHVTTNKTNQADMQAEFQTLDLVL